MVKQTLIKLPASGDDAEAKVAAAGVDPLTPKADESNEIADTKPAASSKNGDSKPAAVPVASVVPPATAANIASKPLPRQPTTRPFQAPPGRKLNEEDAILYLNLVKNTFPDKPQIYNLFLDVLKRFTAQRLKSRSQILLVW